MLYYSRLQDQCVFDREKTSSQLGQTNMMITAPVTLTQHENCLCFLFPCCSYKLKKQEEKDKYEHQSHEYIKRPGYNALVSFANNLCKWPNEVLLQKVPL